MKKKITTLLVGIFAIVIAAHAQAPTVTFTASSQLVCAGSCVTFTNATTGATPILLTWYFPGSNTPKWSGLSTSNPPCITYLYTGAFNVSCVASNGTLPNDSVSQANYIIVEPLPTAYISPPSGGICDTGLTAIRSVNDTIQFKLSDTIAGCQYSWAPSGAGAGISCSTCRNPKVYPYINTVYTLTVTGPDGCVATYTDAVTVGATNMTAQITGENATLCAGFSDSLTASGGATNPPSTYHWNNGATTATIVVRPTTTTTYSVFILSGAGCTASATYTVNVSPVPHFAITPNPDSICYIGAGTPLTTYTVSPPTGSPYNYVWYGPGFGSEDTDHLSVTPSVTTVYTLIVQNFNCFYDTTVKLKVADPPNVHFTGASNLCLGSTTIICASGGDQYTWSTGQTTACVDELPPASINYTVQVRNGACQKDTFFLITVDSMPTVKFKGDTSICVGDSTTIYTVDKYGSPGYQYTYLWNTGSTTDSVALGYLAGGGVPLAGGIYPLYVTVTKGACSVDSAEIKVKVYQHPKPALYPIDTTVCEYDSVQLTAAGGDYYQWLPKNSGLNHYLSYGDTDRNNAAPFVTTVYNVNVCTWGCCKDTSIVINITPNVQGAAVCCNATVAAGVPVQLSATYSMSPLYSIEGWTPATGLSCSTCANPIATVYNTTTYVATFADENGCILQDSVTIDIFNCTVFVPNIFSPSQEVNNILYVRSLCLGSMDFAIFDRFGNKVFETQDQNTGWDGTYKGKPMNVGTYMWYLTGLLQDGTEISKSGNVTLIR